MAAREALSHEAPSFNARAPRREAALAEARAQVIERASLVRPAPTPIPLSQWPPLPAVPVLALPVRSDRAWPPFRRSMRDGYALRFADRAAPLRLAGAIHAGAVAAPPCPPGACVAIMTGAPVPDELDTVVMIEHTRGRDGCVELTAGVRAGDHIAPLGSDSPAGAVVAAAGSRLTPAAVAALAAAGVPDPLVLPPPRVAILVTGDELVPATASPGPSQIRNSNGPMLAAQCRRYGAEVVAERWLPDDAAELDDALTAAEGERTSIIIFSGGASVGSADLVAACLAHRGVTLHFDAVRTRPGRPVLFGELDGRLYFGLPGNPLGALLACTLLVRPALEIVSGLDPTALTPATVSVTLGFAYTGPVLALDAFRPVRLVVRDWGAEAQPLDYHGSADLAAAAAAGGFLHVPAGTGGMPVGTMVEVVLA
ncbi:MAG: molybdopterin molybdotransferase MoeA [Terriglobales bacterium]